MSDVVHVDAAKERICPILSEGVGKLAKCLAGQCMAWKTVDGAGHGRCLMLSDPEQPDEPGGKLPGKAALN